MYICKHCGAEFEKPQQVGGHVLNVHKKENNAGHKLYLKNKEEYEKKPKFCEQCGKPIDFDIYRKDSKNIRFCNKSCAATFNNLNREKKSINCVCCGKTILYTRNKRTNTFCNKECEIKYKRENYIKKWLDTKKLPIANGGKISVPVREYLLEEQQNKCAICGIENVWCDKPLLFVADHIDGNSSDCSRENLRLICSNCDSQTDTYKGKNKGNGRYLRKERYQANKSF